MRKRFVAVVGAAVLAVTAIASLAFSSSSSNIPIGAWGRLPGHSYAGPSASLASHEGGQVLVLRGRNAGFAFVNTNGRGPTPGDFIVFRDRLQNRAGRRAGTLRAQCFLNFPFRRNQGFICEGVASLGRGQIAFTGARVFTPRTQGLVVAITGGTGHWQNARGEIHVRFVNENTTRYTFHILP